MAGWLVSPRDFYSWNNNTQLAAYSLISRQIDKVEGQDLAGCARILSAANVLARREI